MNKVKEVLNKLKITTGPDYANPYLLPVPDEQKKWFDKRYGHVNDNDFATDGAEWWMLKSNIFGDEFRFINYKGSPNGLLDGFWLGHVSGGKSADNTDFFLTCCLLAEAEAVYLEFYEIAFNINMIHNSIISYIDNEGINEK